MKTDWKIEKIYWFRLWVNFINLVQWVDRNGLGYAYWNRYCLSFLLNVERVFVLVIWGCALSNSSFQTNGAWYMNDFWYMVFEWRKGRGLSRLRVPYWWRPWRLGNNKFKFLKKYTAREYFLKLSIFKICIFSKRGAVCARYSLFVIKRMIFFWTFINGSRWVE